MIFDTDVIIWAQRGNKKAASTINRADKRFISLFTYMELLQLAKSKSQHQIVKSALHELEMQVLPISQVISHRAAVYVEEYTLSHSLRAGDAIIAATATEYNEPLSTSNAKNFKCINDLDLQIFRP